MVPFLSRKEFSMLNNELSTRRLPTAAIRSAIILMLACAGIFQNYCPMAIENAPMSPSPMDDTRGKSPVAPSIAPQSMNMPLSTWIGPGDALRIKSFPDTASFISGYYTVSDSGFVTLPMIGALRVADMTTAELTRQLGDYYAKYIAFTSVQVEPLLRIFFLGGFLRPGGYLVSPFYPFSSALSLAGGPVRDDGLHLLKWERGGKSVKKNLTDEVESHRSLWSLGFKSNDQICMTVRQNRDISPLTSYITSTLISLGTLVVTILILNQQNHK
jgi:protein involved in polysaccharide export with SLBB domain